MHLPRISTDNHNVAIIRKGMAKDIHLSGSMQAEGVNPILASIKEALSKKITLMLHEETIRREKEAREKEKKKEKKKNPNKYLGSLTGKQYAKELNS